MSAPFMQFYVADYIADTQHFTAEQHGAYLLILMAMWRCGGRLASDARTLRQVTRLTGHRWAAIKGPILALLEDTGDGHLTQKRLALEYEKANKKSVVRSQAGKAGAAAKALKKKRRKPATEQRLLKHLSEPEPESDKKKESMAPPLAAPAQKRSAVPEGFPHQEAKDAAIKYWNGKSRPDLSARIDEEVEKFRDHHIGHGKKMADWAAAWRTWIKNAVDFNKPPSRDLFQRDRANVVPFGEVKLEVWVTRLESFYRGDGELDIKVGSWQDIYGPKPGQPGCKVPEEAFAQFESRWGPLKNRASR